MSKRKLCLWSAPVVLLALAAAAYYFFVYNHHQVIVFSDDSKLTLLSVDYGKKHVPPTVKTTGTAPRATRGRQFTTTNDTLVLWIQEQYDSKEWHNYQFYVYDRDTKACVMAYNYTGGGGRGNEIIGLRVDAFPRRQSKFYVRVQENSNGNNETADKKFVISNPARRSFPDWTPATFPVAKDDDDVSVTLTKLVAGAPLGYTRNDSDPDDPMNKGVQIGYHVERSGSPVSNWQPVSIVTTDATGNSVNGYVNNNVHSSEGDSGIFQWGLWPDEPAWKVRMEFSQQSDFAPSELWVVPNITVKGASRNDFYNYNPRKGITNDVAAESDLNGIHVKIYPAMTFTDGGNSQPDGGLTVETDSQNLNGMRMTVKISDDHANNIDFWENGTWNTGKATMHRYGLRDLADSTNLTVSIALHKSRFVEFTVKPQKAPESTESQ